MLLSLNTDASPATDRKQVVSEADIRSGEPAGPIAKFGNGREIGWVRLDFRGLIRGQPSLETNPVRPLFHLLKLCDRPRMTGAAVDMMLRLDNAAALSTGPQPQQQLTDASLAA